MRSLDLFVGAGGLALGVAQAGFRNEAVIENDPYSCDTIRDNQRRQHKLVTNWTLHEQDIARFDFTSVPNGLSLVTGGPPCQPFSFAGHCLGHRDKRNLFPQAIRAIRELRPKAFVIENVKGLARPVLSRYLHYLRLQFTFPHVERCKGEKWTQHCTRLAMLDEGLAERPAYRVAVRKVNAADYGVPQIRERVIIVGIDSRIERKWNFPAATHSRESLLKCLYFDGQYWERHKVPKKQRPILERTGKSPLEKTVGQSAASLLKPWRTVRDGIFDLPDPERCGDSQLSNHEHIDGARVYPGHTGSVLDRPAKTLKAGRHGVPGGENMLVKEDGSVRYFTIRECARLQTFPDDYVFSGPWSARMRQVGNAVPVALSRTVAADLMTFLRA
jgi:DNA (cytosine-5)-methyltransferase 1